MKNVFAFLGFWVLSSAATAADVDEIVNYRNYSPGFSSAGQPTAEQLTLIRDAGFERIVYVAYSDQPKSLSNEDRLVKELGMQYVHIPVEWEAPTADDYYMVAAALRGYSARKTLLHCQVNYRASAFSFLYRVIEDGVDIAEAKADMNTVWTPNETWRDLIFEVLESAGVSPECPGCDWTTSD